MKSCYFVGSARGTSRESSVTKTFCSFSRESKECMEKAFNLELLHIELGLSKSKIGCDLILTIVKKGNPTKKD